jgi:choline dehydrogenase-like flavoprotein
MRDVIIVGAGGGGPVMAKELAQWGLDVLVLEAGPRFQKSEEEWTRLEDDANNPLFGYFRIGPVDRAKAEWARELPNDEFNWQVNGVGGTTLHYYANCPRAYRGVFEGYDGPDRAMYDVEHRFPFTLAEFRRYYRWVEAVLPVATAAIGTKEDRFLSAAARMGLPFNNTKEPTGAGHRAQENSILQPGGVAGKALDPAYPQATGCTFCGHCQEGCIAPVKAPRNLKAKRSTDNSYIPMALTADAWSEQGRPITLLAGAVALKVHTDGKRATGVTYQLEATGVTYRENAKVVVLAAGPIETPRLWLQSGLPNPNGWVGRGVTDHHLDWVFGVFDDYTGSAKGQNSAARLDFPGYGAIENVGLRPAFQTFAATYSDAGTWGVYDNGSPFGAQGADTLGRLVADDLTEALHDINKILNCLVIPDDDVEYQNYVTTAQVLPSDYRGKPARIVMNHRNRSARTRRNREYLVRQAVELLRAAGAKRVHRMQWPPLLLHIQSSMRMGTDTGTSVVDQWCESHFVPGLFIADNSALANSVAGCNPTLTTQAMVTRSAERVLQKYFGGDPWVGTTDPVTSIDPKVTNAVVARGL